MRSVILIILISITNQIKLFGQEKNDMLLHEKLERTDANGSKKSDFLVNIEEYNRIVEYQMKKYKIDKIPQYKIEKGMEKWYAINSVNDSIFIYIPPKPDVPRRLLIAKNAIISYYYDGTSVQLIKELVKVCENKYKFKLYHNHKSPFDDGYIPAEFTILNAEKGIAMWKEWSRINEPFTLFFIRYDKSHSVTRFKNRKEEVLSIEYKFDNNLLNEMKK